MKLKKYETFIKAGMDRNDIAMTLQDDLNSRAADGWRLVSMERLLDSDNNLNGRFLITMERDNA